MGKAGRIMLRIGLLTLVGSILQFAGTTKDRQHFRVKDGNADISFHSYQFEPLVPILPPHPPYFELHTVNQDKEIKKNSHTIYRGKGKKTIHTIYREGKCTTSIFHGGAYGGDRCGKFDNLLDEVEATDGKSIWKIDYTNAMRSDEKTKAFFEERADFYSKTLAKLGVNTDSIYAALTDSIYTTPIFK